MSFLKAWLYGYINPPQMLTILNRLETPLIGFLATLIRGGLDSLLLFVPLSIMGKSPSFGGYLTFVSNENYYLFLAFVSPLFFLFQWLFLSGAVYLLLCAITRRKQNIDMIFNLFGITSCVIGSFLILWDWAWILFQNNNYIALGISHLVIDIWGVILTVYGMKRLMGIRVGIGILVNVVWILLGILPAILIMRSPL